MAEEARTIPPPAGEGDDTGLREARTVAAVRYLPAGTGHGDGDVEAETAAGKRAAADAGSMAPPASGGEVAGAGQENAARYPRFSLPADFRAAYGLPEDTPVITIPHLWSP